MKEVLHVLFEARNVFSVFCCVCTLETIKVAKIFPGEISVLMVAKTPLLLSEDLLYLQK